MRIFLTHARKAATEYTEFLDDLAFPQTVHWFPETYKRVNTGMFYVPHLVADKVLDAELATKLREDGVGKTAFILAAGNANFAGINPRNVKPTRLSYVYKFLPFSLTQVYAGRVAQSFGVDGMVTTDSSACASGLKVLMDVQTLIKNYGYNRVIVLAVEDQVANSTLDFFGESKAILSEEEAKTIKPSAFDKTNYGFYVGQGAALAVFEAEHILTNKPIAELKGAWACSENATNAIGQREDGEGFKKAIEGALFASSVHPKEIKIVKAHGTGTKSNNNSERNALLASLGNFVATSYKQRIGHTMGASGLLESLMLFDDMEKGYVPEILNRTEHDEIFLSEKSDVPDGCVLSLAAGMGNIYAAAVFDTRV
jgi:3-oxoacyl-[acyl-carrier-protein] synthase II